MQANDEEQREELAVCDVTALRLGRDHEAAQPRNDPDAGRHGGEERRLEKVVPRRMALLSAWSTPTALSRRSVTPRTCVHGGRELAAGRRAIT